MMPEVHTCDRCKKKYDKDGGAVTINVGPYNFAVMDTLCMDCLEELQKWIDKGTDEKEEEE